jgi:hypothetical protein
MEVVTPMLAFFRSDTPSYQPSHPSGTLLLEDGNPQASLENLKRLGLTPEFFWVRCNFSRVLIQFNTGEQYVAFGLGDPKVLARLAADAGLGEYKELCEIYEFLPPDYDSRLPTTDHPTRPIMEGIRGFERGLNRRKYGDDRPYR